MKNILAVAALLALAPTTFAANAKVDRKPNSLSSTLISVSFQGPEAAAIYNALNVKVREEQDETLIFQYKKVGNLSCKHAKGTDAYECVLLGGHSR